jgi:muramoyltetrapeptide carboxypeptidase
MNTIIAGALQAGGTIGIVSPASPCNTYSDVLRGIAWWEARGYHVKLAEGALERTDWVAGSPELRAWDVMAMFLDPGVDAIQCLRGGYGSAQIIPYLDFEVIAARPTIGAWKSNWSPRWRLSFRFVVYNGYTLGA